jgi:nucleotide-binding universal stress UspA family protein
MHTIVVGVDGSEAGGKALRFAIEEARIRGGEVKAVSAWHVPAVVYEVGWTAAPIDLAEFPKLAQESLEKTLEEAGVAAAGVTVTPVVREGQPADILCEEAEGADLLVVGSRGLGGFRGLLLGSVSQQCANHAPCPVVIIPHERGEAAESSA